MPYKRQHRFLTLPAQFLILFFVMFGIGAGTSLALDAVQQHQERVRVSTAAIEDGSLSYRSLVEDVTLARARALSLSEYVAARGKEVAGITGKLDWLPGKIRDAVSDAAEGAETAADAKVPDPLNPKFVIPDVDGAGLDELEAGAARITAENERLSATLAATEKIHKRVADMDAALEGTLSKAADATTSVSAALTAGHTHASETFRSDVTDASKRVIAASGVNDLIALLPSWAEKADALVTEDARVVEQERQAAEARKRAQQQQRAPAAPPVSGGGNGNPGSNGGQSMSQKYRSALDSVGGTGIPIQTAEVVCGAAINLACIHTSAAVIHASYRLAARDYGFIRYVFAHELAHVYSAVYTPYRSKAGTPAYNAFGGDFEHIADCMAKARIGYSYGRSCTAEQLSFARGLWGGNWG